MIPKIVNPPVLDTNNQNLANVLINTTLLQDGQEYTLSPSSTYMTSLVQPTDNVVVQRVLATLQPQTVSLSANVGDFIQTVTINNVPDTYSATIGIQQLTNLQTTGTYTYLDSNNFDILSRFYIKVLNNLGEEIKDYSKDYYLRNGLNVTVNLPNSGSLKGLYLFERIDDKMVNNIYGKNIDNSFTFNIFESYEFDLRTTSSNSSSDLLWLWILIGVVVLIIITLLIIFYSKSKTSPFKTRSSLINY